MPAKLIWHSEICPAKPTRGTSDRPMMATARIRWTEMASGCDTICAATTPAMTTPSATMPAPPQAGRGMISRMPPVEWPRRRLCGSTSSTTNSRMTGMAKRNCDSSTLSVGR